ncbi:hypothetical protein D3C76_1627060 [compost metagenome]
MRELTIAIEQGHELILSLVDSSIISGIPSWGEDRSRVRIKLPNNVIWVPLDEIEHVTTLLEYEQRPRTS